MAWNEAYRKQVALLIRLLPLVAKEECFALKGGTAINLFLRDLPRLSVDIDLTYLPVAPRAESLAAIDAAMRRIADRVQSLYRKSQVVPAMLKPENAIVRLTVRDEKVQVKIEVTPVLRGTVFEPERRTVTPSVEQSFGFAEMQLVSFADLFAGKIVAALDRQHPRDFFDIRQLLANEGITQELRHAFVVYLISHNRPMHEVLSPPLLPLQKEFLRGFDGMTSEPVSLESLEETRDLLIHTVVHEMPQEHRRFLLTFERGMPDWQAFALPTAKDLPAVQWRQRNLDQLTTEARARLVAGLEAVLLSPQSGEE